MNITILSVGKSKERYWNEAVSEYTKRLTRYGKVQLIEVADEKTPDKASEALCEQIRQKEGERLIARYPKDGYRIALAINGKERDSIALANHINDLATGGHSHLVFIIGGSLGLSCEVLAGADEKLSFSRMTFPHQLMRVILLEQIYRANRIIQGEPYHK